MSRGNERVGTRVAAARKVRGLTQAALASRMHVSTSLISQVERGVVPASPTFVAAAARVLGVTVGELWDQPPSLFGAEREHVGDLETAVMEGADALAHDGRLDPLDELAQHLEKIVALQRKSQYRETSGMLPDILRQLHMHAAVDGGTERVRELLARTYNCALYCLHRLGSPLSAQAAERAALMAGGSGDPLLAAHSQAGRAVPLLYRGSYAVAERVIQRAQHVAENEPPTIPALTVRGAMHLQSAIVAARRGDAQAADAHLAEAGDLARHVPDTNTDHYDTGFSSTNVGFHAVASAVELGDGTLAVTRGVSLDIPSTVMRSRRGHFHIDMAGAWLLHGDRESALTHLRQARTLTPQQTRYHPQVREIVGAIAEADRRRTDGLASFARWVGMSA